MVYNYQTIDELYGAPLNTVGKPHVPFKIKTWHVVAGVAVLGLTCYGAYHLYNDIAGNNEFKFKNPNKPKEEPQSDSGFNDDANGLNHDRSFVNNFAGKKTSFKKEPQNSFRVEDYIDESNEPS